MSTQQTDALQCAADLEYSIARHGMQDAFTLNAYRAMKMVRTQHARIADLEAQLESIGAGGVSGPQPTQTQAVAVPPTDEQIQEAEPLLDYAMQIAHERELRVTGFPHDEDGAKRVFEAAVMRHTATVAAQADSAQEDAARKQGGV